MASTSIQRSRTAGSTKTKFTISMWVKKSANNAKYLMVNYTDDSNRGLFQFGGSDELLFQSKYSNSNNAVLQTNRKFRDVSAWYHFVLTGDSTLSTAADRLKLYVNGVRETSFASETQISQNGDFYMNEATTNGFRIGEKGDGSDYFDGYMSHVHFVDGAAYQASTFGSTDANTGEWIINTSPTVTYGTNGFFLKMEDGTNMDLDSSSNNLTFSTNGNLNLSQDNPSNNFPIISIITGNALELQKGGLKSVTNNGETSTKNPRFISTLGYNTGKFYWETKISTFSTGSGHSIGLLRTSTGHLPVVGGGSADTGQGVGSNHISLYFGENTPYIGHYGSNVQSGAVGSFSSGDIIGISHDLANGNFIYYKNGSQIGTTITSMSSSGDGYMYFPQWTFESKSSGRYCTMEWNLGNGFFGTTAISSAGTNASTFGIFEYDVPANHSALCTKALNL